MSEYGYDYGTDGGYGYEEGIDPSDPYAAPGYEPEPDYGYDEQGYDPEALAEAQAVQAYLQGEIRRELEPLEHMVTEQVSNQMARDGQTYADELARRALRERAAT